MPEPTILLKPCPFCGGSNLHLSTEDIDGWMGYVACLDCNDMRGPASRNKYADIEEAKRYASMEWNGRSYPPLPSRPTEPLEFVWGDDCFNVKTVNIEIGVLSIRACVWPDGSYKWSVDLREETARDSGIVDYGGSQVQAMAHVEREIESELGPMLGEVEFVLQRHFKPLPSHKGD